jgi:cbb3-type cytochrome oxidase maturation protein
VNIIYVLIPLSVILMVLAIGFFFWAVKNDQFDDLDTPALDILDEDEPVSSKEIGTTEDTQDIKNGNHGRHGRHGEKKLRDE